MVEGTGLENQQVNSLAGSNPALSAKNRRRPGGSCFVLSAVDLEIVALCIIFRKLCFDVIRDYTSKLRPFGGKNLPKGRFCLNVPQY